MNKISSKLGYNIQIMVRPGINRTIDSFSRLKRFTVDGSEKPEKLENIMKQYKGLDLLDTFFSPLI